MTRGLARSTIAQRKRRWHLDLAKLPPWLYLPASLVVPHGGTPRAVNKCGMAAPIEDYARNIQRHKVIQFCEGQ